MALALAHGAAASGILTAAHRAAVSTANCSVDCVQKSHPPSMIEKSSSRNAGKTMAVSTAVAPSHALASPAMRSLSRPKPGEYPKSSPH
jgi:hypothetical protein